MAVSAGIGDHNWTAEATEWVEVGEWAKTALLEFIHTVDEMAFCHCIIVLSAVHTWAVEGRDHCRVPRTTFYSWGN